MTSPLPRECSTELSYMGPDLYGPYTGHLRPSSNSTRKVLGYVLMHKYSSLSTPHHALERETGIEPALSAWKAEVLPLNYSRGCLTGSLSGSKVLGFRANYGSSFFQLVEGAGFEPAKAEPTDLQSAPFDRFGTPPQCKPPILRCWKIRVKTLKAQSYTQSRGFRNNSCNSASAEPSFGCQLYSQLTEGGIDIRIDSVRPPDCRPNNVPRSYIRLNST